jgi:hypothetical protein
MNEVVNKQETSNVGLNVSSPQEETIHSGDICLKGNHDGLITEVKELNGVEINAPVIRHCGWHSIMPVVAIDNNTMLEFVEIVKVGSLKDIDIENKKFTSEPPVLQSIGVVSTSQCRSRYNLGDRVVVSSLKDTVQFDVVGNVYSASNIKNVIDTLNLDDSANDELVFIRMYAFVKDDKVIAIYERGNEMLDIQKEFIVKAKEYTDKLIYKYHELVKIK